MNLGEYLNGSAKDILASLREKRTKVRDFVGDVIKTQARPALQKIADYTYSAATNRNSSSPMIAAIAQKSTKPITNAFGNIGGFQDFRVAMDKNQTPEVRKQALNKTTGAVMGFVGSIGGTGDLVPKGLAPIFHGTPEKFAKFDVNRMEGGQAWFTDNVDDITSGTAGAVQKPGQKLNIITRYLKPGLKFADEELSNKYYTDQLIDMGYAGRVVHGDGKTWYSLFFPNRDLLTRPPK